MKAKKWKLKWLLTNCSAKQPSALKPSAKEVRGWFFRITKPNLIIMMLNNNVFVPACGTHRLTFCDLKNNTASHVKFLKQNSKFLEHALKCQCHFFINVTFHLCRNFQGFGTRNKKIFHFEMDFNVKNFPKSPTGTFEISTQQKCHIYKKVTSAF